MEKVKQQKNLICFVLSLVLLLSGVFGFVQDKSTSFCAPDLGQSASVIHAENSIIQSSIANVDEIPMIKNAKTSFNWAARGRQKKAVASLELFFIMLTALSVFFYYLELTDNITVEGCTKSQSVIIQFIHQQDGAKG